jgi:hypothetical protein
MSTPLSPRAQLRAIALVLIAVPRCDCSNHANPLGGDGGAGDGSIPPGLNALSISPINAQLATDGIHPAQQTYTVTAHFAGGATTDVSAQATLTLGDPTIGTLVGPQFTSALTAGVSLISAQYGTTSTTTKLTVKLARTATVAPDPGLPVLPPDPGPIFTRAPNDPGRAPELIYPNDGVMLPPNLGGVEVHYRSGSMNTLFAVHFVGAALDLTVYTRCSALADGCLLNLSGSLWTALSNAGKGGDPVALSIVGTDDRGSGAGTSATFHLRFAAQPVRGGLYYWTTSNGTGILRLEFGAQGTAPQRFFPFSGGGCYGCHALSKNGLRMSLSENGQFDGRLILLDVPSETILHDADNADREQFQSWAPTSDRFVAEYGDDNPPNTDLRIRSGSTAAVLETIPIGNETSHPDWSPLGDRIIFTWVTHHYSSQRPGRCGIGYVSKTPTGWSAPMLLIQPQDGLNHYYPSFSPDGQFFVYDVSHCARSREIYGDECDADSDPSSKLHAMAANGGAAIPLDNANRPGVADGTSSDLTNSFPRWAPFVDPQRFDGSGRVMWMTFSSRRNYGLRTPGPGQNGLSSLWLWMVAIDPDRIMAGSDGSFAAFALPFQDLTTSNHIAQWAAQVVPPTPGLDGGMGCVQGDIVKCDGGSSTGGDAGQCLQPGDTCDPNQGACCSGSICSSQGGGLYVCKPKF